jgi:chitinase
MSLVTKLGAALGACCATASLALAQPDQTFAGHPLPFTQSTGKVVAFYLDGGSIASDYRLDPVTLGNLTHLLYAFLAICGPGQTAHAAQVCTPAQDFELAGTAPFDDATFSRYFAELKARAPHLKLLASIGGAEGSKPFYALTRSPEAQAKFVESVRAFLASHPMFDGVDIDWEFPTDSSPAEGEANLGAPGDARAYADLMHALRGALDGLGGNQRKYLLTSAVLTAARLTRVIDYRDAAVDTDLFFAMTYDYYGPWTKVAGHHAPVIPPEDPGLGPVGITPLLEAGIPASKLVDGVAAYGRGWQVGPTGDLVADYNGQDGTTLYRELASQAIGPAGKGIRGVEVHYDKALHAYSLWNPASRVYVGYDDPRAVAEKGRIAVRQGLAGLFGWELSQDNGDLVNAMNRGLGNKPAR